MRSPGAPPDEAAPDDPPPLGHTVTGAPDTAGPAHAARPRLNPARTVAAVFGVAATLVLVGVGTAALLDSGGPASSSPTSANRITVAPRVPLSDKELGALVGRSPDFGPLTDARRRASCLDGLGYPGSQPVLGAQPVEVNGRAAIVLVLPGDEPGELIALAVATTCSAVSGGLIADTTVTRP